jgi:hypothetical protein
VIGVRPWQVPGIDDAQLGYMLVRLIGADQLVGSGASVERFGGQARLAQANTTDIYSSCNMTTFQTTSLRSAVI